MYPFPPINESHFSTSDSPTPAPSLRGPPTLRHLPLPPYGRAQNCRSLPYASTELPVFTYYAAFVSPSHQRLSFQRRRLLYDSTKSPVFTDDEALTSPSYERVSLKRRSPPYANTKPSWISPIMRRLALPSHQRVSLEHRRLPCATAPSLRF